MGWFSSVRDSFRINGQFSKGRRGLLFKNYEGALEHFQQVVDKSPVYVFTSGGFRVGVWTYVGRCQYYLGKFAAARHALERAVLTAGDDHLARLFLGLTLARQGDDANALRQMELGLKGLGEWIEYENGRSPSQAFWDPSQQIRKEIIQGLAMISAEKSDRQKLIESAEWIGLKMEDEIDQVRRERRRSE
jgi:tetratricopeptide (TPR) repeat protein